MELKLQNFGHLMQKTDSLEKTLMLEKIEDRRRRGRQDETVGWHHRLNGHEFEQAPVIGDGQGGLACCDSWGHKELDTTERLNSTELRTECIEVSTDYSPVVFGSQRKQHMQYPEQAAP